MTIDLRDLRADCSRCVGLCCVAPAFAASADFAIDKPAGRPCPNLRPDHRCGIHAQLRDRGFRGCTVYDCFGAGQKLTQHTFAGQERSAMFAALPIMRGLHELLYYLTEALTWPYAAAVHKRLLAARAAVEALTRAPGLLSVDVNQQRAAVNPLLLEASELARRPVKRPVNHRGADLAGARLSGKDLRGASLRGAVLIGADLTRADLRLADLIGADLRDAALAGADLSTALFLTQAQLASASGDAATRLPAALTRPAHWTAKQ